MNKNVKKQLRISKLISEGKNKKQIENILKDDKIAERKLEIIK